VFRHLYTLRKKFFNFNLHTLAARKIFFKDARLDVMRSMFYQYLPL
jgi:hypothetical protein